MIMNRSQIYLRISGSGTEMHFSGVTQIRHALSLKVATDTDTTEIIDYLNGAREQPAKVTLSLLETDTGHTRGYAARMLEALDTIRSSKVLVEIYTPVRNYMNMILSDLVIIQEDGNLNGWTGTATFTEVLSDDSGGRPVNNGSASSWTGTTSNVTISSIVTQDAVVADSPLRELLQKVGIVIGQIGG